MRPPSPRSPIRRARAESAKTKNTRLENSVALATARNLRRRLRSAVAGLSRSGEQERERQQAARRNAIPDGPDSTSGRNCQMTEITSPPMPATANPMPSDRRTSSRSVRRSTSRREVTPRSPTKAQGADYGQREAEHAVAARVEQAGHHERAAPCKTRTAPLRVTDATAPRDAERAISASLRGASSPDVRETPMWHRTARSVFCRLTVRPGA